MYKASSLRFYFSKYDVEADEPKFLSFIKHINLPFDNLGSKQMLFRFKMVYQSGRCMLVYKYKTTLS